MRGERDWGMSLEERHLNIVLGTKHTFVEQGFHGVVVDVALARVSARYESMTLVPYASQ